MISQTALSESITYLHHSNFYYWIQAHESRYTKLILNSEQGELCEKICEKQSYIIMVKARLDSVSFKTPYHLPPKPALVVILCI